MKIPKIKSKNALGLSLENGVFNNQIGMNTSCCWNRLIISAKKVDRTNKDDRIENKHRSGQKNLRTKCEGKGKI